MNADATGLYRLMSWLSPAFPVGAYAFSHGLEWQVEHGGLSAPDDVRDWLAELLLRGSGHTDLVVCAAAWRSGADGAALGRLAVLALALAGTAERLTETRAQGVAFIDTVRATWSRPALDALPPDCPYPVAVGVTAHAHGVPIAATLTAYAHAFASNLVSAAVRLVPLGQTDGQRITAALEPVVADAVARARDADVERIGSATLASDVAAMRHETQYTRLFRS